MVQYLGNKIKTELTIPPSPKPETKSTTHAYNTPSPPEGRRSRGGQGPDWPLDHHRHTRTCVRTQPRQVGEVGSERTNTHTNHMPPQLLWGRLPPERIERTMARTKRRESSSPWRLLQPPTHTLTPPTNTIGGAHRHRSVVSTRQAAIRCDSTPPTHRTGRLGRLRNGLSPYTTSRHTRNPTLCGLAACHKHMVPLTLN